MAAYEVLLLNTAVPQIQAAQAGDTYVCPRDIQITANLDVTGNTILGDASTDTVQVNGYMGVGGAANANAGLRVANVTTVDDGYGVYSLTTARSSSNTTHTTALFGKVAVPDAAFTYTNAYGIYLGINTKGASATLTNSYGLYVNDQTQGTNNYGITSAVSSGANKWNIYASGTAANYFAGNVGIGTTSPTTPLSFGAPTGGTAVISIAPQTGYDVIRRLSSTGSGFNFGALYSSGAPYIGYQVKTNTGSVGYLSSTSTTIGRSVISMEASLVNIQTGVSQTSTDGGAVTLVDNVQFTPTTAVFNEDGADIDFRVESDTNTHALFVQGSDGNVGIGSSAPTQRLDVSMLNSGASGTVAVFRNAGTSTVNTAARIVLTSRSGDEIRGSYIEAINVGGANYPFDLVFGTSSSNSAPNEKMRIDSSGNVKIGGTADRATTVGTKHLDIFDGTAPVGTLANGISIYSSSGEAYVMDAAGNATLFSPHDAETNEWIFKSKHTPTGKVLKIDVERLLKFVNDHFGLDAVHEFIED